MSDQGGGAGAAASATPESPAGDRTPPLQRIELLMIGDELMSMKVMIATNKKQNRFMADEAWWDKFMDYMLDFDPCHRVPRTASSGKVYRSPDATGAGALVAGAGLLVIRHVLSTTPAEAPRRGRGPGRR